MRALLLYNSRAGRGRIVGHIEEIIALFASHGITLKAKELSFDADPFEEDGDVELVVVSGGDGTINFVVNKMFQRGINPQLGIIPSGTANDFARAIGMPRAIMRAAQRIAEGQEHKTDCGCVDGTWFVNVLSFGVLTTTSQQTLDKEKQLVGRLAYIRTGAHDLMRMHPIPLKVRYEGKELEIDAVMCLVFNGMTAGSIPLAPDAKLDDGMLDVLILEYHNPVTTCFNMLRHLVKGHPGAVHHLRCSEVEITTSLDERTDMDGQPGPKFPMHIRCAAGSLRLRY
jgi:YegS/Rv2252/BmrU family lipid kinase